MTKSELRTKYRALRKSLSSDAINEKSIQIANQLLQMDIWDKTFFHIFLSIESNHEIQTEPILNILNGKDKNIVVPKSHFETQSLTHYLLTDSTLIKPNAWNIPEPVGGIQIQPEQIDVIFVPLLAYDVKGNRVGYGKGFYDQFLSQCRPNSIKIGLSFFAPEEQIEDLHEADVSLNFCVSPHTISRF